MNPTFIEYYNQELAYIREQGAEFAAEFEKIAGRLGLDRFEVADPYVERLMEGFAFLTARVHLKLDAQFPKLTQHLLEIVHPNYLAPRPSMAVVRLQPDPAVGSLVEGVTIPRGTAMRSRAGQGVQTACEYRTAHDVQLWPLTIDSASYIPNAASLANQLGRQSPRAMAAIRLRLKTFAGLKLKNLKLDRLVLHVMGGGDLAGAIFEQMLGNAVGCVLVVERAGEKRQWTLPSEAIDAEGFSAEESLLPATHRSFDGYRLLEEYFTLPQRFLFPRISGLSPVLRECDAEAVDVYVLLDRSNAEVERGLDGSNFGLYCVPVINLFPRKCDRIALTPSRSRYHVVVDRNRPQDFEVHSVTEVAGYGDRNDQQQRFWPMYASAGPPAERQDTAFYTLIREQRQRSSRQQRVGTRSSYVGSETFMSIVDANEAPFAPALRQLSVTALCTNRDLPIQLPVGRGDTDFTLEIGAPVKSIRCIAGPTRPTESRALGAQAWRLVDHLSLNYLSINGGHRGRGDTEALKSMLMLYCDDADRASLRQIDGVAGITSAPITARLPVEGPVAFGRGVGIEIECEESAFEGASAFLLGAVLERFFARYVSINSFTQLTLRSTTRAVVMKWPVRAGRRELL